MILCAKPTASHKHAFTSWLLIRVPRNSHWHADGFPRVGTAKSAWDLDNSHLQAVGVDRADKF
jgi:hypothetical protein